MQPVTMRGSPANSRASSPTWQPAAPQLWAWLVAHAGLAAALVAVPAQLNWLLVLTVWVNVTLYTLRNLRGRPFLLAFCAAFFVFLLGGETLTRLFGFPGPAFPPEIDAALARILGIGLVAVWTGYVGWVRLKSQGPTVLAATHGGSQSEDVWVSAVCRIARVAFWVTLPFAFALAVEQAVFVSRFGYLESYTDAFLGGGSSVVDALVAQIAAMNFAALAVYLAAMPARRPALWVLGGWLGSQIVALASGQRAPLVSGVLFVLCYLVIRSRLTPRENWLPAQQGLLALAALPVGIMLLEWVQELRGVRGAHSGGIAEALPNFFLNQGVSATVVARGMEFRSALPGQTYLLEFIHRGIPARLLGLPVLQGNSLERALEGGSYGHSVSYVLLGDRYLAGAGSGSSFLAEANVDLGILGVLLVGVMFGVLLAEADRLSLNAILPNTLRLLIVPDLILAPRSSATAFISTLLAPSTFVPILAVLILAMLSTHSPRVPARLPDSNVHPARDRLATGRRAVMPSSDIAVGVTRSPRRASAL